MQYVLKHNNNIIIRNRMVQSIRMATTITCDYYTCIITERAGPEIHYDFIFQLHVTFSTACVK